MSLEEVLRLKGLDMREAVDELLEKQGGLEGRERQPRITERDIRLKQEVAGMSESMRKRKQVTRLLRQSVMKYQPPK